MKDPNQSNPTERDHSTSLCSQCGQPIEPGQRIEEMESFDPGVFWRWHADTCAPQWERVEGSIQRGAAWSTGPAEPPPP